MCTPSQMSSAIAPLSATAPTTPGARWEKGGIAWYRWMARDAPRRNASIAVS